MNPVGIRRRQPVTSRAGALTRRVFAPCGRGAGVCCPCPATPASIPPHHYTGPVVCLAGRDPRPGRPTLCAPRLPMNWLTFIDNAEVAGERISSVLPEAPRAWRELEHPVNGLRLAAGSIAHPARRTARGRGQLDPQLPPLADREEALQLSKGDAIARALFVEAAFRED